MRIAFRKSFERDLKRVAKNRNLLVRIKAAIEAVENAESLAALPSLKNLSGSNGNFYRLRLGSYRLGLEIEGDEVTFVRCLHRRDIYRHFP